MRDIEWNKEPSKHQVFTVGDEIYGQQRTRSNSAADLETAITKTGCGKFNILLVVITFTSLCTANIDTGSMSYLIPAASVDLDLKPIERALLQSACYAGMILSGIFWGFMSDAFGRKKLLIIGLLTDALLNILAGVFPIPSMMILFKFLAGVMVSAPFPIIPTYVMEVTPIKGRDISVLAMGMYGAIGCLLQAGLARLIIPAEIPSQIPFKSWQLFQIACSLPALISGIGCIFLVESPKFLADKGDKEGALKVCQTIYSINTGNHPDTYPIKRLDHKCIKTENKSNLSKFLEGTEIFRPPFVQKAMVMFLIYLGIIGSFNVVRLWLPEILTLLKLSTLDPEQGLCPLVQEGNLARTNLTSEDLNGDKVFSNMIFLNTCVVVGHIIFLLVLNFIMKQIIQFICILVAVVCPMIIPFISADYVVIFASICISMYDICLSCIVTIILEMFPTRLRATTLGISMLAAKTFTFLMNFLMVKIIYTHCEYLFYGLSSTSLIVAGLMLLAPRKPIENKILNPLKGK